MADRLLYEALSETFPASDPVSLVQPAADQDGAGDPPGGGGAHGTAAR